MKQKRYNEYIHIIWVRLLKRGYTYKSICNILNTNNVRFRQLYLYYPCNLSIIQIHTLSSVLNISFVECLSLVTGVNYKIIEDNSNISSWVD